MNKVFAPQIFGELLAEICTHTPIAKERPLRWTIIANPTAGGFTIGSRWKKHLHQLQACVLRSRNNPLHNDASPTETGLKEGDKNGLVLTRQGGHARSIAETIIDEAGGFSDIYAKRPFNLIITAGGDGTSLEVLTALYHAPAGLRSHFAVLRLPMGTGNDGADAWELEEALNLLIEPAKPGYQRALKLTTSTPGKGPFLAFNILSVGLDACVTHMTNKMKGKLPGDSYKLWVDIASLLYDKIYKVGHMDVRAFDNSGREVKSFSEKVLLLAVGESGRRTYGSHKWILPDDRNVCMVKQMPILRKVALKGLFTTGGHISKPESAVFNAHRVEFSGEEPILAQMDGETVLLQKKDFPAAIELTELVIPVLKL
jgi:diacylglycerol kinase family enzyme